MMTAQPPDDESAAARNTIAAALVLALLVLAGWWVLSEMARHRAIETCLAAGRRDCLPLEAGK